MEHPIIDITYFVNDINLPGGDKASINGFVSQKEPEYLEKVLGYELYKALMASTPAEGDRFYKLLNGAEYTDSCGKLQKWPGFKNAKKESAIAYYTYYWYLRDKVSEITNIGAVAPKGENSNATDSISKQYYAWRNVVRLTKKLIDFINNSKDGDNKLYPEFDFWQVDASLLTDLNPFF